MRVKVIIKEEKEKNTNNILSTTNYMTMTEARKFAKEYDKTGILWIKAKWFDTWHCHYRSLWDK